MIGFIAVLAASCQFPAVSTDQSSVTNAKLNVLASVPPLSSITMNVAGDGANVENLLPLGASPHTYALTPADLQKISRADVFIETGLQLEEFLDQAIESSGNSDLMIVRLGDSVPLLTTADTNEGGLYEPNIWLSIENAIIFTDVIAETLSQADPAHAEIYASNAAAYTITLQDLDAYTRTQLGSVQHPKFISLHPAWAIFADAYGLEQIAAIEVIPGQEPSAKELVELISAIRQYDIRALLSEPQLDDRILESIAHDTGLPIYLVDPLGTDVLSKTLYEDTMKANVDTFAKALQ